VKLLIARNKIASLVGIDAATPSEILHVEIQDRYVVGEKNGVCRFLGWISRSRF
jgi:hypothetical protein